MLYYDIIPFRRLPWGHKEFTYSSLVNLPLGTLVQIYFSGQKIHGLVWRSRINSPPGIKIQPIIKVVKELWFTKPQQDFFNWVSQFYATPLSTLLYLFGVIPVQRGLPELSDFYKKGSHRAISNWQKYKQLVLQIPPVNSVKVIADLCKAWQEDGQLLILCPTIKHVQILQGQLMEKFSISVQVFYGQLNRTHLTIVWQQVLKNKNIIIIGTTAAAFLPFNNLKSIIVWPEADSAGKAIESRPLTQMRNLAVELSKIYQTHLGLIDHSPSLEAAWLAKSKRWPIVQLAAPELQHYLQLYVPPLLKTPSFLTILKKTINEQKKIIIIAPRLGEGGFLQCQDCSYIFNCPHCQLAYRAITTTTLKCHYCRTTLAVPTACPACRGVNLKTKQLTVNYIIKELSKEFKDKIIGFDAQSLDLPDPTKQLVVATTAALYRLSLEDYSLRVVMGFDVFLQQPQFNATARTYYLLRQLLFCGPTMVETMSAQHKIFNHLNNWSKFVSQELNLRQRFDLPPIKSIIKLSIDATEIKDIEQRTHDLYMALHKIKGLKVNKPLVVPGRSPQRRFRRVILIEGLVDPSRLAQLIKLDYSQWTLDPDPVDFS